MKFTENLHRSRRCHDYCRGLCYDAAVSDSGYS